ncbi:CIC11C00000004865 [Sungouiella intermedia]|uniref:CIC11C00000004865 n=1 Tax=Sungouiella intermedia TaxID=45354 RepID=A0A1L0BPZ4_9ASCO|nr:CIC11C00000004865 [[Candida] intermedia]
MINKLPVEIQVSLLKLAPESSLKGVNSHFYLLYNDLFYDKLIKIFGDDVINIIAKVYPWLRTYIISLDAFRYTCRHIIASRLGLTDIIGTSRQSEATQIMQAMFVRDSWKYIFSLFKNKRLFAEYSDYTIDEPTNYIFDHYVEINRSYLLSYSKTIWLSPGRYNLNIALVIKHGTGLGTTKFEVKHSTSDGNMSTQTFYPPSNINEILPKKQFCFLKVGEFQIPNTSRNLEMNKCENGGQKMCKVQLTMEEIGLFLKSGFRIFFIDISQPSMLFNDYDLLFYSCKETDYKYFINLPLKNFYKALNFIQNGGVDDYSTPITYGSGNPFKIQSEYDYNLQIPESAKIRQQNHIMRYANFYYQNTFRRCFKFNTVYQKRQFVNRFGNYETEDDGQGQDKCVYDPDGLKWKIPIVGEL